MGLMLDQKNPVTIIREKFRYNAFIWELFQQLRSYPVTNSVTISILESYLRKTSNIQSPLNVTAFLVYPVTPVTFPLLLKRRIFYAAC